MKKRFTRILAAFTLLALLIPFTGWADNVTILPSDGTSVESDDFTITKAPILVSVTQSTLTQDQIRVFKNQTITISSSTATITGIEFTCTANGTAKYGPGCLTTESGYTYEQNGPHGTWSGSSSSIVFTASSNQARITQIVVTYTTSGGGQSTTYTVTYNANGGTGTMTDPDSPYEEDDEVTLLSNTFGAPDGQMWNSWLVKDASNNPITVTNGKFTMPASNVTVTAQWVADPNVTQYEWVETALADLETNDVFVIVGDNGSTYALSSANGTSSAPAAIVVTIANGKINTNNAPVTDDLKFNISGDATNGYTFYPNGGDMTRYIYCTDANNGVRVGKPNSNTTEIHAFTVSNGYLKVGFLTARYIGIYNSQDWRCYTSNTTGSNIAGQTFKYYKRQVVSTDPAINASDVNIAYDATSGTINYTIDNPDSDATIQPVVADGATITNLSFGTPGAESVSFTCDANSSTTTTRTAVVTLNYVKNDVVLATKDVTITQAAAPVIYSSIEDIFNAATSTEANVKVSFGGWVVTGVKGSQAFVSDGTNGLIIYQSDHGFVAGNTLTGTVDCRLVLYYGAAELKGVTNGMEGLTVGTGGSVTPQVVTASQLTNGIKTGAVLTFENLAYNGSNFSDGTNTITVKTDMYDYSEDVEEGNSYTVTGVYEHSLRIYPRSANDIEEFQPVQIEAIYDYSINGLEGELIDAYVGEEIILADGTNLNSNFTFVGWTTDPNDVTNLLNGSFILTDEETVFYAVYQHSTTVGAAKGNREGATYEKVTSSDDITDGNYLIVNEEEQVAFNGGLESLDAAHNTIVVSIDEDVIASSEAIDAAIFTIDVTNGTLKSASGKYIGVSSNSNGLNQTDLAGTYTNSFDIDNNGNAVISAVFEGSTMSLRFNSTNNENSYRFRYYKNAGQQPIQLYKYTEGGVPTPTPVTTTARYTRVFLANPTANVSIVGPSIIPNGITLNMGENELSNNLGAASFIIEDGAQYIGNSVEATVQKNIEACTYSQDNNAGYNLIASPVFDNLTAANVKGLLTNYYDLYKFDNTHEREWINYKAGAYTIDPEVGYLYASGSNTIIEFAGDLNEAPSSDVYDVTVAHKGFNLIGNPLPYNVAVVDEEFNLVDYQVLTSDGGAFEASSNDIAPCNAILVQTANDNETVYFLDPSLLEESKAVNIKLVENAKQVDNVRVRFGEGRGMNKFYLNNNISHVYFQQGNEEMAIVRSAAEAELPVSFRASENGTYTLAVEAENIDMNYLHLIDNMTGMDVDLLQTPSYTFEANTNDYANRFKLVFAANGADEADESSFAFFSNGNLIVNNEGNATLQVIDINGRILSSETISGSCSKAINATTGVYMLRLINGDNVKVQKVVVR